MYILIVPILGIFMKKKVVVNIWISVLLAVSGLYLLCMKERFTVGEGDLLIATLGDGRIGHIDYICKRAKEAGAFIYVVTGSPSGSTAQEVADRVFFVPAAVYRGTDPVVPSTQPMGNLFEQSLLLHFDIIIMTLVDEIPDLSFEKMSHRHRNVE